MPHLDKWVHGAVYGVFLFLLLMGWRRHRSALTLSNYSAAIMVAVSYGGIMEILQLLSEERSFEWLDIAANTIGAIVGSILYYSVFKFFNPKHSSLADIPE